MTSFENIREIRGKYSRNGNLKSEDSEHEERFQNSRMT